MTANVSACQLRSNCVLCNDYAATLRFSDMLVQTSELAQMLASWSETLYCLYPCTLTRLRTTSNQVPRQKDRVLGEVQEELPLHEASKAADVFIATL